MPSLRGLAGLREMPDESCGNDEDELALELEDNNKNEIFRIVKNCFPILGRLWLLDRWPTRRHDSALRRVH